MYLVYSGNSLFLLFKGGITGSPACPPGTYTGSGDLHTELCSPCFCSKTLTTKSSPQPIFKRGQIPVDRLKRVRRAHEIYQSPDC